MFSLSVSFNSTWIANIYILFQLTKKQNTRYAFLTLFVSFHSYMYVKLS